MWAVKNNIVGLLKKLIQINSVNPTAGGSGEAELSNFIADYLECCKIEVHTQKVVDERCNVIGILRGEGDGPSLMLNGHLDTVGVKGMTIDPFKPSVKRGNIHGRGACDMKGGLAGMMVAMAALANSDITLKGDLLFSGVIDEEYKSLGTEKLMKEYHSDATLVGEPTSLRVGLAHKGFLWLEIEIFGKAAHGSVPEKGIDAIARMANFIQALYSLNKFLVRKKHPLLGSPTVHASAIAGGTEWSLIPDFCNLKLERRTIPGEDSLLALNEINGISEDIAKKDHLFNARIMPVLERQPLETSPNVRIVKSLEMAIREVRHRDPQHVGVSYWSDAALFSKIAHSTACLFGPGDIGLAHSPDEYVNIREVCDSAKVYALTAQNFCGTVAKDRLGIGTRIDYEKNI